MSTKSETVGQRVRRVRLELGKTQAEFAAMLGVQRVSVARWELGLMGVRPMVSKFLDMLEAQRHETLQADVSEERQGV